MFIVGGVGAALNRVRFREVEDICTLFEGVIRTRSISLGREFTYDVGRTLKDIKAGIDVGTGRALDIGKGDRVWANFLSRGGEGGSSLKGTSSGVTASGFSHGGIFRQIRAVLEEISTHQDIRGALFCRQTFPHDWVLRAGGRKV